MSAPINTSVSGSCCAPKCTDATAFAIPGPKGVDAFTFTTAIFVMPAVGANVTVPVQSTLWTANANYVFVDNAGFFKVESITSPTSMVLTNLGYAGNVAPGVNIGSGSRVVAAGIGGTLINAYTTTTAAFTMPAINANVSVAMVSSSWAVVGQPIFVGSAGSMRVAAIVDGTHLSLTNLGYPLNAAPAANIGSPQGVSPMGERGATGATGLATLNAISPTTTKGDLIVDNGANHPTASDVRLAVGTDGKALVADSSQPTGVNYAAITPNVAATDGDIVLFSGTTGTPMALKDSKLLITSDGAIQSTPTGGNARGSKAVDLQVDRGAATQVASGSHAVLLGQNGTSSGANSTVSGGISNSSTSTSATVSGGSGNLSSGPYSTVSGGLTCQATGTRATVGGGEGNISSLNHATIGGGLDNLAGDIAATVAGGSSNVVQGGLGAIGGGGSNLVSATYACIPGGFQGVAYLHGQVAHSATGLIGPGDAQTSELLWHIETVDATAGVESFLDGISVRAVVPLNTTWLFVIHTIARSTAGVCFAVETKGAIQNNANTVSLVAALSQTVVADGTGGSWGVTGNHVVSADNVNKSLKLAFTGPAGVNVGWVSHARMVEVAF